MSFLSSCTLDARKQTKTLDSRHTRLPRHTSGDDDDIGPLERVDGTSLLLLGSFVTLRSGVGKETRDLSRGGDVGEVGGDLRYASCAAGVKWCMMSKKSSAVG
jgi:hypothetical protein